MKKKFFVVFFFIFLFHSTFGGPVVSFPYRKYDIRDFPVDVFLSVNFKSSMVRDFIFRINFLLRSMMICTWNLKLESYAYQSYNYNKITIVLVDLVEKKKFKLLFNGHCYWTQIDDRPMIFSHKPSADNYFRSHFNSNQSIDSLFWMQMAGAHIHYNADCWHVTHQIDSWPLAIVTHLNTFSILWN